MSRVITPLGHLGHPPPTEDGDKKDTRTEATHSPSSPPRNHITVRSSRRSVGLLEHIAYCIDLNNTPFFQSTRFLLGIAEPPRIPWGHLDKWRTRSFVNKRHYAQQWDRTISVPRSPLSYTKRGLGREHLPHVLQGKATSHVNTVVVWSIWVSISVDS